MVLSEYTSGALTEELVVRPISSQNHMDKSFVEEVDVEAKFWPADRPATQAAAPYDVFSSTNRYVRLGHNYLIPQATLSLSLLGF